MARTQSKKRRLFGFAKTSNSTSSLTSPLGRSETRAGDPASVPENPGTTSPGRLARMRRYLLRSKQGPSATTATETTDRQASGGPQVPPDQGRFDEQAAAITTSGGAQDQEEQPRTAPTKNVCGL
ncbi:hypothetical protein F5141DRAFT_1067658 [Pisolithus sp. B1]|nr:hypothetical protein F5141DRAFT_1067658 [Pisolithus sp. B1]